MNRWRIAYFMENLRFTKTIIFNLNCLLRFSGILGMSDNILEIGWSDQLIHFTPQILLRQIFTFSLQTFSKINTFISEEKVRQAKNFTSQSESHITRNYAAKKMGQVVGF